jgi:DNA recombination protein RmuC
MIEIILCVSLLLIIGTLILSLRPLKSLHQSLENLQNQHNEFGGRLTVLNELQNVSSLRMQEQLLNQERHLNQSLGQHLEQMTKKVHESLEKSSVSTLSTLSQLGERMAVLDHAQNHIQELSGHVMSLQDILGNKQARGVFGEMQLNNLIVSLLPPSAYEFQASLEGKRVDCLLTLPNPPGSIAIDSKFPLEGYRLMNQADNELERKAASKLFKNHVLKHIYDIQEKYIIPGITADSALMFLPSEAVYAELHANFLDVIDESHKARVWIVSPTTLMATLHTIRAVLKDVQMKEQAGLIQKNVMLMIKDLERLEERCQKLEGHFSQTQEDVRLLKNICLKLIDRAKVIENIELEEPINVPQVANDCAHA